MYYLCFVNERPLLDECSKVKLNYLIYLNKDQGILVNLKNHIHLDQLPVGRSAFPVGNFDAFRFHTADYETLINEDGTVDWESDKLEPRHIEYNLELYVEYPQKDTILIRGIEFNGNTPLVGYNLDATRTNYNKGKVNG